MSTPGPGSRRRLGLALLSHPTVQGVRFGTKLALAWFLTPALFGEAMLAGSLAFAAGHLALLGLDEAWLAARRPGPGLFAALAAVHRRTGLTAAALLALAGLLLRLAPDQALLGALLLALAPMVALANRAVLPTALLVRAQRHDLLLLQDLAAVLAFAAATLGAAALGAGPWCLVAGWYANALVTVVVAGRLSRDHRPAAPVDGPEDDPVSLRRFGRQLAAADLTDFAGERLDGLVVGFGLGRAALGLYEQAGHVAGTLVQYGRQLAERTLQPLLAARRREEQLSPADGAAPTLGPASGQALRQVLLLLLPAHVVLAEVAPELVTWLPPSWHGTGGPLAALALAAGLRCVELAALTALKAGDHGLTVARLGLVRLVLLGAALVLSLRTGDLLQLALAVAAVRGAAALLAVALAAGRVGLAVPWKALVLFAAWLGLQALQPEGPAPLLPLAWALGTGLALRLVADRAGLAADLALLRPGARP